MRDQNAFADAMDFVRTKAKEQAERASAAEIEAAGKWVERLVDATGDGDGVYLVFDGTVRRATITTPIINENIDITPEPSMPALACALIAKGLGYVWFGDDGAMLLNDAFAAAEGAQ